MRWARISTMVLAGIFAAALALVVSVLPSAGSDQAGPTYVALGDSYTAGPLIPTQQPDPLGCFRSDHNYPHLVAATLGAAVFRDASCSGAGIDDMTAPQNVTPGPPNPPQFDRLDASTTLVTLGISGNDLGFTDIIKNCASASPAGSPCQDHYVVNGDDTLSDKINALAPQIASVVQGIHGRAPQARVIVVAYPAILPDSGPGCWPQMPMTDADVPYLRSKERELDSMLAAQASANAATFADTYSASVGHDACQAPGVRFVEPISPASPAAPVHPNLSGMECAAAVVVAVVRNTSPASCVTPASAPPAIPASTAAPAVAIPARPSALAFTG